MPLLLRACLNLCDDQRPVEPFFVWGGRKDGWHNKTAVTKSDRQKLIIKLKNNFTTPPHCYLLPTIRSFQFCFIIQILSDILVWKRDYFLYGALTSESSSVTKTTIRVFVQEMNQHKTDNCDRRKILCFGRGHSSFMGWIAWSQLMTKFQNKYQLPSVRNFMSTFHLRIWHSRQLNRTCGIGAHRKSARHLQQNMTVSYFRSL